MPKIGRNQLCPCGSGRKYKKCCLGKQSIEAWDRQRKKREVRRWRVYQRQNPGAVPGQALIEMAEETGEYLTDKEAEKAKERSREAINFMGAAAMLR